jgi:hypothetical protein
VCAARQILLEQRIEHDARRFLEIGERPVELLLGPHQRMHMLHRQDFGILRRSGAGDGDQGLAGRVRNQVQMKIAWCLGHSENGITCRRLGRRPWLAAACKSNTDDGCNSIHIHTAVMSRNGGEVLDR